MLQARDVLERVDRWVAKQKGQTDTTGHDAVLRKVEVYIREVDFCLQSLTLALTVIQSSVVINGGMNFAALVATEWFPPFPSIRLALV
jgi:hypothetical protein